MSLQSCSGSRIAKIYETPTKLLIGEYTRSFLPSSLRRFSRVAIPGHLREYFEEIRYETGLTGLIKLVMVKQAGGAGGLYIDGANGLVVVGQEDTLELASQIWHEQFVKVSSASARVLKSQGYLVVSWAELLQEVRERVVAHEVGHAMLDLLEASTPYQGEERSADYLAGWLDGLLGKDREIGEALFYFIGCTEAVCSHPSPEWRRHAYSHGYDAGQAAAWRQEYNVADGTEYASPWG